MWASGGFPIRGRVSIRGLFQSVGKWASGGRIAVGVSFFHFVLSLVLGQGEEIVPRDECNCPKLLMTAEGIECECIHQKSTCYMIMGQTERLSHLIGLSSAPSHVRRQVEMQ